jgi:thiol-disulfide isomerase/thioredoxin
MQSGLARRWLSSSFAFVLLAVASAPAWAARTAAQIERDLQEVNGQIQRYPDVGVLVQPKYRVWVKQQFAPLLQRKVQLLEELEQADPRDKVGIVYQRDFDLAVLALAGDDNATRTLEQASGSVDATDALTAKLALSIRDWWSDQTVDAQQQVLTRLVDMAKADPKNDLIGRALIAVADHGAASEELARQARDTVANQMSGQFAIAYKAIPNKRGWPLVISGTTAQGKSFTTAPWKGKVVLVDFWATWCPPCRASLPHLVQLYHQYHDSGLELVGVSNDQQRSDLVEFLRQNPDMTWPQLFGPSSSSAHWNQITERFGINGIPTVYLIDRNGTLRLMETGGEVDDTIKALLEEKPDPKLAETPVEKEPVHQAAAAVPAAPPAPAVNDAAVKAAAAADDADVKAARALSLAKSYITAERYDAARTKLQSIMTTYPGTPTAKDADALIKQIEGK